MALPRAAGGGYAEAVAVDESLLVPLPDGASFEEGASFLLTFLTAWIPLTRQVRLRDGRDGARARGRRRRRLGGDPGREASRRARGRDRLVGGEARGRALELGADEALLYDEFEERVKADVVLDPVGGDVFTRSLATLNPLGTLVALGFAGGWWEPLDPAPLVGRNLGVRRLLPRAADAVPARGRARTRSRRSSRSGSPAR